MFGETGAISDFVREDDFEKIAKAFNQYQGTHHNWAEILSIQVLFFAQVTIQITDLEGRPETMVCRCDKERNRFDDVIYKLQSEQKYGKLRAIFQLQNGHQVLLIQKWSLSKAGSPLINLGKSTSERSRIQRLFNQPLFTLNDSFEVVPLSQLLDRVRMFPDFGDANNNKLEPIHWFPGSTTVCISENCRPRCN